MTFTSYLAVGQALIGHLGQRNDALRTLLRRVLSRAPQQHSNVSTRQSEVFISRHLPRCQSAKFNDVHQLICRKISSTNHQHLRACQSRRFATARVASAAATGFSSSVLSSHSYARVSPAPIVGFIAASFAILGLSFGIPGNRDSASSSSSEVTHCQSRAEAVQDSQSNEENSSTSNSNSSNSNSNSHSSLYEESQADEAEGEIGLTSSDCFVERNVDQSFQIFTGTSNPELAREICSHLGMALGRVNIGRYADGEITLEVLDEVRGKDIYVVQSAPSASSNSSLHASLMELFLMVAALKRASAKRVTAVLPYMSYFRQTDQTDQSKPFAAADISLILTTMGVDRVVFVDVHTRRAEGFFNPISTINLQPQSLAAEYFKRKPEVNRSLVVVSTHNAGTEQTETFMSKMQQAGFNTGMAALLSNRPERPQKEAGALLVKPSSDVNVVRSGLVLPKGEAVASISPEIWLVGDVKGKDCLIVDDIIDTGERAVNAAYVLKSAGAKRIYMYATHGLFSRGAIDRIIKSPIKEVVVTNTIRIPENLYCEKLRVISVSLLLAEAIRRLHHKLPLSELHRDVSFDKNIVQKRQK